MFSDGNKAWQSEAKARGFITEPVTHGKLEFTREIPSKKKGASHSLVAGTQSLDRTWGVMKDWIPNGVRSNDQERLFAYMYSFQFRRNSTNMYSDLGDAFRRVRG